MAGPPGDSLLSRFVYNDKSFAPISAKFFFVRDELKEMNIAHRTSNHAKA